MTIPFERGFADAERSALAALRAGGAITSAAKQMQKAAQEGDIAKLRRAADRLASTTDAARQDAANAKTAWPFSEEQEKEYFATDYERELLEEAHQVGLSIQARDARLFAYPSILQIQSSDLAVKIDRKRVTTIRPSFLAQMLLKNQTRPVRNRPERLLESLFNAYRMLTGRDGMGDVVLLTQIYQAFTLQPGSAADYDRSDFARDIFMLDQSGITRTKSGHRVALPASAGARGGGSNVLQFVAPTGDLMTYYGLKFTEE